MDELEEIPELLLISSQLSGKKSRNLFLLSELSPNLLLILALVNGLNPMKVLWTGPVESEKTTYYYYLFDF